MEEVAKVIEKKEMERQEEMNLTKDEDQKREFAQIVAKDLLMILMITIIWLKIMVRRSYDGRSVSRASIVRVIREVKSGRFQLQIVICILHDAAMR